MSRSVFVLMLGLCLFAAFGSVVEAEDCEQSCASDRSDRECSTDPCCSCCVHFRVDRPRPGGAVPCAIESRLALSRAEAPQSAPDPREVLHVPKAILL